MQPNNPQYHYRQNLQSYIVKNPTTGFNEIPYNMALARILAYIPEISKLATNLRKNHSLWGNDTPPPQHGYLPDKKLDEMILKYFLCSNPTLIMEEIVTFHPHIWQQYSICLNTNDELRAFDVARREKGSYYAFYMMDYSALQHFRKGLQTTFVNPWIQPQVQQLELSKDTKQYKPTVQHAHHPYTINYWPHSKNVKAKKEKDTKKSSWGGLGFNSNTANNNTTTNIFGFNNQLNSYFVPFLLCEVITNPEHEVEDKPGWIYVKNRDEIMPCYLLFLSDHLEINDIVSRVKIPDQIHKILFEERVNGLWSVIRWLVMGKAALTWVLEFHSVFQGLPSDLVQIICRVMLSSKIIL